MHNDSADNLLCARIKRSDQFGPQMLAYFIFAVLSMFFYQNFVSKQQDIFLIENVENTKQQINQATSFIQITVASAVGMNVS